MYCVDRHQHLLVNQHSPSTVDRDHSSVDRPYTPATIDIPPRTSIDTEPRDMVATLVLIQDAVGNLHDQEGHLCNAAGQKIYDQGAVISDPGADIAAAQAVEEAARTRTLADYNMPY